MQELLNQKESLEAALVVLKQEEVTLNVRLKKGSSETVKKLSEFYRKTKEVVELDVDLQKLTSEKARLEKELPPLQEQHKTVQLGVVQQQKALKAITDEVESLDGKLAELRDAEAEVVILERELDKQRAAKARYEGEISTLQTNVEKLEREYGQRLKQLDLLDRQPAPIRREVPSGSPGSNPAQPSDDASVPRGGGPADATAMPNTDSTTSSTSESE